MQNDTANLEDSLVELNKHPLTIDPAIVLLGIYLKELKTYAHVKTYTIHVSL